MSTAKSAIKCPFPHSPAHHFRVLPLASARVNA
jgi:hypothetical protein